MGRKAKSARNGLQGFAADVSCSALCEASQNADDLTGDTLSDNLYGGAGDDTLTGKGGNDYLEGGQGNDTYVINASDGTDTVLDSDGSGSIVFNGITLAGGALVAGATISKDGSADGIRVQGWQPGQLGLTMAGAIAPSATTPITGLDGYSDALTGTGGADLMQGLSGNDALDGSAGVGDDLLGGSGGSDSSTAALVAT